jgi:hypothetical protein
MHSAGAAGLGPAAKAELFEQLFHFQRDLPDICPTDARTWIEIDPQLVRVVKVGGTDRVRM